MALPERQHAMFKFGSVVTDTPIRINGDELLRCRNAILNPNGVGFKKRKGTELLSEAGTSLNPSGDIFGFVWYSYDSGQSPQTWQMGYAFETTEGTKTNIVLVDFGDGEATAAEAAYDAWVTAAEAGSYDTNYNHDWVTSSPESEQTLDETLVTLIPSITDAAHLATLTQNTLTIAQASALNSCVHGVWTKVAADAGKTGEGSFDLEEDIVNSGIELSRRNETTQARTRYRLATYYDASVGYIITLDHASNDSLAITGITTLKNDLWADGKPDWAVYQNRAHMVNGVGDGVGTPSVLWTDGVNVHNSGITAPTVTPVYVSDAGTGGYLEDGTYRFKYTFYRSDEYTSESNTTTGYLERTISNGTSTQKVTITFTYSDEDQVDKLRIYRTKLGATSTYYYEQQVANVDGTGTVNVDCGTVADGSLTTQASDSGLGTGNERPPDSNFICMAGNRGWYATETYVYYSQLGYPEQVPSVNLISITPDDGESITNIQAFSDYVFVQKQTKTFIIDANNPGYLKPRQLSNNIGTVAKRSSAVSVNGQMLAFLSQEGFYISDGRNIQSICEGKIYENLMQNVDKDRIAASEAAYYPNDMQYMCYVPYLNSQYRFWVYSFRTEAFQQFTWSFRPHSITLWTDENDIKRLVIGTFLEGVESGRRSYFGHWVQADYEHYKDVQYSATCGSAVKTYQAIEMEVITSPDFLGSPDKDKYFNALHTYMQNTAESTAVTPTITWATDFGASTAGSSTRVSHSGIGNKPSESDWQHGYDYVDVFDYQSYKAIDCTIGELHGKDLSIRFNESSQNFCGVAGYMVTYQEEEESHQE